MELRHVRVTDFQAFLETVMQRVRVVIVQHVSQGDRVGAQGILLLTNRLATLAREVQSELLVVMRCELATPVTPSTGPTGTAGNDGYDGSQRVTTGDRSRRVT